MNIRKNLSILTLLLGVTTVTLLAYPHLENFRGTQSLTEGEWKYFEAFQPANSTKNVSIQLSNLSDDLDLYIKRGSIPTLSDYDERSIQQGTRPEHITPTIQQGEKLYIGIYGYRTATATAHYQQLNNQSDTTPLYPLLIDKDLKTWHYDTIEVAEDNTIINIKLHELTDDMDLYISKTQFPTLDIYDQRSIQQATRPEELDITLNIGEKLYIGAYAYKKAKGRIQVKYNGVNPLITTAKEHCLNDNNTSNQILCSNETNKVYMLTRSKDNEHATHHGFYEISINPNNESINILREETIYPWFGTSKYYSLKKLEDTPLYRLDIGLSGADPHGFQSFYYRDQKVLNFSYYESEGFIYNMYSSNNGEKLIIQYRYIWNSQQEGDYTDTYDISDPANPILIESIKNPLVLRP